MHNCVYACMFFHAWMYRSMFQYVHRCVFLCLHHCWRVCARVRVCACVYMCVNTCKAANSSLKIVINIWQMFKPAAASHVWTEALVTTAITYTRVTAVMASRATTVKPNLVSLSLQITWKTIIIPFLNVVLLKWINTNQSTLCIKMMCWINAKI